MKRLENFPSIEGGKMQGFPLYATDKKKGGQFRPYFLPSGASGFTLLEILIAVFILSIGILAVSQLTILGQRSSMVIKEQMEARETLARGIEVLKILPIGDPLLYSTCGAGGLDSVSSARYADTTNIVGRTISPTIYDLYWNVADDLPATDQKTIRMIILNRNGRRIMDATYVRWR
jgi:prepilin-type N-terminal cleavage/methylation domain-containing protein